MSKHAAKGTNRKLAATRDLNRVDINEQEIPKQQRTSIESRTTISTKSVTTDLPVPKSLKARDVQEDTLPLDAGTESGRPARRRPGIKARLRGRERRVRRASITNSQVSGLSGTVSWRSAVDLNQTDDLSSWAIRHHREHLISTVEKKPQHKVLEYIEKKAQHFVSRTKDNERQDADTWGRPEKHRTFRISLAEMQRMRLRKLQCKMVQHAVRIHLKADEPDDWEWDLECYSRSTFL